MRQSRVKPDAARRYDEPRSEARLMLYLYALVENLDDVAGLTGIQGERLELHPWQSAAVVAGEVTTKPAIAPEALRAQDAVVRTLHQRAGALLPMRFGTMSADVGEMERALQGVPGLLQKLAAVRGCEQMTLRVLGAATSPAAPVEAAAVKSGTEYLMARARRQQPSPALQLLADCVRDFARSVRIETGAQPGLVGSVYHLIARGADGAYRETVDRAVRELQDLRVLVSGPSPPYAFA
jgi:hypothetical protein